MLPANSTAGGALLNASLDEQSERWQRGDRVLVEEFLQRHPELARDDLAVIQLVMQEHACRRRAGDKPSVEEYSRRFPSLEPALRGLLPLLNEAEQPTVPEGLRAAGHANQSTPNPLKIRCPYCHNPINLCQGSDEVLCPACGSSFRLREAPATETMSGMKQIGRFQLLERLGLGGFGAVWKARDTELDRTVALKIPHAGLLTEAEENKRFQREARATAQLRHPNIVTVYEVSTLNGIPTIVSEYVAGEGPHWSTP